MRSQYPNPIDFTSFQENGVVIWILRCLVSDVAIITRILVGGIPDRTRIVEIVGEYDSFSNQMVWCQRFIFDDDMFSFSTIAWLRHRQ